MDSQTLIEVNMFSKRFFRGGADVPHRKTTADCETVVMPPPPKVVIPLLQHIGVIGEPKVQKGDAVKVGQILGVSKERVRQIQGRALEKLRQSVRQEQVSEAS